MRNLYDDKMRISFSLGSLLSVKEVIECSKKLQSINPEVIWVPETWGMENFSTLCAVSQNNAKSKLGSSIINIYSRSPSLIAMGAATVDTISNNRMILGLGTSSMPIVQDFHGVDFDKPLQRMREYVEIIRLVLSGNKVNYSGKIFALKNFTLLIKPPRNDIPIYLAAINKKMVELTWEIADGVIFYLRPKKEMSQTIENMQKTRVIDTSCQIITCISENENEAKDRARKTLAFYISVGDIYRKFLSENGYKEECKKIFDEFKKTGFSQNHKLISENMLNDLTICGRPESCKEQLIEFRKCGIKLPIIQFNPIGDVMESFELFTKTFAEE